MKTPQEVAQYFELHALKELLGANLNDVLDEMLATIPQTPSAEPQAVMFGHTLGTYAGMNRQTIKDKFGLTDANVDDIFEALGIVE